MTALNRGYMVAIRHLTVRIRLGDLSVGQDFENAQKGTLSSTFYRRPKSLILCALETLESVC